jgi:hypothetical protein
MGACSFITTSYGKTAREAFDSATEQSRYESGHSYSGEIGMKNGFKMFVFDSKKHASVNQLIDDLIMNEVSDKWGPAGCIDLGSAEDEKGLNKYVFFGFASS